MKKTEIIDIPVSELDREILMSIGKIKRQKQRPDVERLHRTLEFVGSTTFSTQEQVEKQLNDMVERKLLQRMSNHGLTSYREINSAIAIVAINNPIKSRQHLLSPENGRT